VIYVPAFQTGLADERLTFNQGADRGGVRLLPRRVCHQCTTGREARGELLGADQESRYFAIKQRTVEVRQLAIGQKRRERIEWKISPPRMPAFLIERNLCWICSA